MGLQEGLMYSDCSVRNLEGCKSNGATPPNSEIICVQNVGAKVEMVLYLKK